MRGSVTQRQMQTLQDQVARDAPMFTLEATQRRAKGLQHWRVARHRTQYAFTGFRPGRLEMEQAQWQDYSSGHDGPSAAAITQLRARLEELKPKAREVFREVTAPRLVMESISRVATQSPETTLATQMVEVLERFNERIKPITRQWTGNTTMRDSLRFGTGETLHLITPDNFPFQWTGTSWGMYEHLEDVVAALARWERVCQAIAQAQNGTPRKD